MEIHIYSDIHSQQLILPDNEPDIVILLGDIDWRDVKKIDKHYQCEKIGVIGNHDPLDTFNNTSVINLHENVVEIKGMVFGGFGGCPRYNNKHNCGQYEEWEADKFIKRLDHVDVFIAHSNPVFELGLDKSESHRGFMAFNRMMEHHKVRYYFHGHIHENAEYQMHKTDIISTYGFRRYTLKKEALK